MLRRPHLLLTALLLPTMLAACGVVREIQQTPIELTAGTVRGQVLDDHTSYPITGARLNLTLAHAESESLGSRSTWSYEEGTFQIGSVAPGTYRLEVEAEGYGPQTLEPVVLRAGELYRVTLRLKPQAQ